MLSYKFLVKKEFVPMSNKLHRIQKNSDKIVSDLVEFGNRYEDLKKMYDLESRRDIPEDIATELKKRLKKGFTDNPEEMEFYDILEEFCYAQQKLDNFMEKMDEYGNAVNISPEEKEKQDEESRAVLARKEEEDKVFEQKRQEKREARKKTEAKKAKTSEKASEPKKS